jgi:ribonuclease HII
MPDLALERACRGLVCGVDEAGRGPLAGPVSAAAVILDPGRPLPAGLDDSKVLTARRRDQLEAQIKQTAVSWAVAFASVEEIAELNILQAAGLAMRRAVLALDPAPDHALVDGNYRFDLPCTVQTVVGGDGLSASIAAASILAKTARDREMVKLDLAHPGYGFARHKGYGAKAHREALKRLGPCPAHRLSWTAVRVLCGLPPLSDD